MAENPYKAYTESLNIGAYEKTVDTSDYNELEKYMLSHNPIMRFLSHFKKTFERNTRKGRHGNNGVRGNKGITEKK